MIEHFRMVEYQMVTTEWSRICSLRALDGVRIANTGFYLKYRKKLLGGLLGCWLSAILLAQDGRR
jgi:hypothetical protein